ncbi:hypothetical protein EVAR_20421_1 [Eumeta japonica]|uniref:Reverse transcriptase domain-containing protein n=1 Tax=Eumeta variegata TaxID=151549 RepID=A0A4C1TXW3_EUMVA|nr:hypothetical protein EVAR_20421_1 [Eumeta japonica]
MEKKLSRYIQRYDRYEKLRRLRAYGRALRDSARPARARPPQISYGVMKALGLCFTMVTVLEAVLTESRLLDGPSESKSGYALESTCVIKEEFHTITTDSSVSRTGKFYDGGRSPQNFPPSLDSTRPHLFYDIACTEIMKRAYLRLDGVARPAASRTTEATGFARESLLGLVPGSPVSSIWEVGGRTPVPGIGTLTRLKGKVMVEPSNADLSILIGLAFNRANEDAAVLASSYQKNYLNVKLLRMCVYALDMSKPLEEREEFWADVRDILVKRDRKESIVILVTEISIQELQCLRHNKWGEHWLVCTHRGVRLGFVASLWIFNLFMDSCVYDLKDYECRLRRHVKCLLYADVQVIFTSSPCGLQEMVNK